MEKTTSLAGKKIDKSRIISLEKGKIPPQAVELEEAVLGAMMIDKKGIDDVIDILSSDAFMMQNIKKYTQQFMNYFKILNPLTF